VHYRAVPTHDNTITYSFGGRGVVCKSSWVDLVVSYVCKGGGGGHEAQAPSHLVKNYRETWS
jgi:hypothetical protein